MRGLAIAALVPVALSVDIATAQTVKTIIDSGPTANRYDLVVLGDGYTAGEEGRFDQDVFEVAAALFDEEPYKTFGGYFNVHSVFRASAESGADHPDADPPISRNTAYGASYDTGGTGRCLYITNSSLALQDASLAPATEGRVIVLVNDSRYGGCAGTFSVSYNGSQMADVQVHELGHSFGGLADEYDYPNQTYSGPEPSQDNVTASPSGNKWSQWHGFDGIGAFEGARYYLYGLFRPRVSCMMRSLGVKHCAVCAEQLVLEAYRTVDPIENASPVETDPVVNLGAQQLFSFDDLTPPSSSASIVWKVDGEVQPETGSSFVLDTLGMSAGPHAVEVEIRDQTAMVRLDPDDLLTSSRAWSVLVFDAGLPDLSVASVDANLVVTGGQELSISTLIENLGTTGDSGSFELEHFLSSDIVLDADDIYLGSETIANLAPGQSSQVVRSDVRIPLLARPQIYYLFAQLDRVDAVDENHDGNNAAHGSTLVADPGCGPFLEYRDPLLYPQDSASLDPVAGGSVLPRVIARCAAPGTSYLIVWGCSGTSPGTEVMPGITVPLNADACTSLGLRALNGPVFTAFYGTLDALGHGDASFDLPPGLPIGSIPGHLAAVLLDGSGTFVGASNPVELLIGY